ncbi:MAG: NADP-dependent oxidoreductase [Acidobacteriota bacterium]|nr:NADP-dependent oxidoreductase [Acidobacteriota bacterium]
MTREKGIQIVLAARPQGKVTPDDFRLEEFALPEPSQGEFLMKVDYLSLDPYMRGRMDDRKSYAEPRRIGEVMPGETISTIIVSNHADYSKGEVVLAHTGWRTHAVSRGEGVRRVAPGALPVTTQLGVLGMPGFTAYAGMKAIGKPVKGETVVVAAASGPVGSLVGQLAKIAGARAVGIAGGSKKCAYLKEELQFDAAADHRSPDFPALLAAACPQGIDVYFENVGGAVWQAVLPLLNRFARVPVSGLVAQYDGGGETEARDRLAATMRQILNQRILVRGFINYDFAKEYYADFLCDVAKWISEGRVKFREDIIDGLENAPQAFIGMLAGKNFGKLLVRVGVQK